MLSAGRRVCYRARLVARVYTRTFRACHHELDAAGRVYPAAYLRWLAQAAIEASTDAGFDAAWYATAGTMWLVRRSTFEVVRPLRADARATVRTWVDDFRRVRSFRRYELLDAAGETAVRATTDWVYVDVATTRPRRIPEAMEHGFGLAGVPHGAPRADWDAPPPPPDAARTPLRVRWTDLDALAHVNNATYLDLAMDAALEAFAAAGWRVARWLDAGVVPLVVAGDVEYVEAALYGDRIMCTTWTSPAPERLVVHQTLVREGASRPLVRANTTWCAAPPAADVPVALPAGLAAALGGAP